MNEPISLPEILDADVKRIRTLITGLRDYASCINEPAYASAWIRMHEAADELERMLNKSNK